MRMVTSPAAAGVSSLASVVSAVSVVSAEGVVPVSAGVAASALAGVLLQAASEASIRTARSNAITFFIMILQF